MTTTTNEQSVTKADLAAGLAIVVIIVMGGVYFAYGAIIGAWLGTMATITVIGAGGAVAIGLIYGAANGLLLTTKKAVDVGYHVAFLNEELAMKRADTLYRHAEIQQAYANSELVRAESVAKAWAITEISTKRGAMVMINGIPTLIPPIQSSAPTLALDSGMNEELETNDQKLFDLFAKAKAIHALILGSRNSGKSTLVNRLMNEEFQGYQVTIIDILFNQVDSGWLLPSGAKVSRDFVPTLKEFYTSHKKLVDTVTTSRRGGAKKLLVIDEFPSLLASLKATDKRGYDDVMAMLRSIYSNGSHTNHNVILLSQTVLSEDIGLSSNDKGNFIQVALGSLAGDYLSLRRGKAASGKRIAYERLAAVASEHDYFAIFEDTNGAIDCQPLPDLSAYGAKRLYGQSVSSETESQADFEGAADCTSNESAGDSDGAMVADNEQAKLSIFDLIAIEEADKPIVDMAQKLMAEGKFSLSGLHKALTGKVIGGSQSAVYKAILAKYGLLETVQKAL